MNEIIFSPRNTCASYINFLTQYKGKFEIDATILITYVNRFVRFHCYNGRVGFLEWGKPHHQFSM